MKQADDYLRVMVESPKGTVNTASDPFEIEYKDISVKKTTMNDVASVELSADLVTETRLNLYTYVELKSGKTLIARYQNTCTEERDVELTNQYEIDNRIAAVGSVVEWRNVREGNRRFCLYEQEGLAAPEEGLRAWRFCLPRSCSERRKSTSRRLIPRRCRFAAVNSQRAPGRPER